MYYSHGKNYIILSLGQLELKSLRGGYKNSETTQLEVTYLSISLYIQVSIQQCPQSLKRRV